MKEAASSTVRHYLALLVLVGALTAAPPTTSLLGLPGMPCNPAKDIKFEERVDGHEFSYRFFGRGTMRVLDERQGQIRIFDGHREGWVNKADFVLATDALAYYDRLSKAHPDDPW